MVNSKHYYNYFLVRQCTVSMLEHTRRFCHAGGAVSVFMQRLEAPIMEEEGRDRLMMWKYCTQCELITPIGTYRFNDRLSRCIHKSYEDLGYFDPGCRSGFEYYGRSVICSWRVDPTKSGFAKLDSAIGMQY